MFYKNLKITTKLVFSSAVFILPVAVMLFFIVSSANLSILTANSERAGINCLRPIVGLLQTVPLHLRLVLDSGYTDITSVDQEIGLQLNELTENLRKADNFGKESVPGRRYISGADLLDNWDSLRKIRGDPDVILTGYYTFLRDLQDLISFIGDASHLVVDPELESWYFSELNLTALPQTQERIVQISNRTYAAHSRAILTEKDYEELQAYGILFSRSDIPGLQSSLEAALAMLKKLPNQDPAFSRELISWNKFYLAATEQLIKSLNMFLNMKNPEDPTGFPPEFYYNEVIGAAVQANTAAYRMWIASLNQLDVLLDQRIAVHESQLRQSLIFAVILSLIAFSTVIITTANITKSTASLKQLFKSLDANDLSLELKIHSRDEFGELMSSFNRFLGKLRSAFVSFNQDASRVSTSVYDLSASAKEVTTTANEQSASVSEMVSTMEASKDMSKQVAVKTAEVAKLAAKTRELSQRGAELREVNQEMMQDIRDQNNKIIDEIKNLAEMLGRISEAIGIIDSIADQTKLIAFNASLEASSSGEAGARFAVVASEIRRFADNVVDSTGEIKQKIEEVQAASQSLITEAYNGSMQIDEGYERMVEQKAVFENIVENSKNVAVNSQQISDLSRKQEYASSQIFITLQEISAGVKQFVIAMASTSKTADNLNVMSKELRKTVGMYRTGDDKLTKTGKIGDSI
jgi:methyl-accepting chemotaxis protein